MTTFAAIAPLIGGNPLGFSKTFNVQPEYCMSYPGFFGNDQHYMNYTKVPYHIDSDMFDKLKKVDVVVGCLPCAGLSSLSPTSSADSKTNDWMIISAKDVLGKIKPVVFYGENAPRLATAAGRPVVERLLEVAKEHGYSFSLYKTKSILHGLSQVRERSFYFFWKGDKAPIFNYYEREMEPIETLLEMPLSKDDPMNVLVRKDKPSDNPFYKFCLEKTNSDHANFMKEVPGSLCVLDFIEENYSYKEASEWMVKNGYERAAARALRMHDKLAAGGNIMRRETYLVKGKIGAFVGHLPTMMAHPKEDRYLTYRECLRIMKMPEDFILLDKEKNINHICQNVPVTTAADMAYEIKRFIEGECELVKTSFMIQNNISKKIEFIKENIVEFDI